MNNLIVQDGEFGISSVLKAARPTLHPGGILRSARTAMKNFDGPTGLTSKMILGRMTQMASLDLTKYILDNLPGQSWAEWRTTQGDSFKESLAQRVAPKEVEQETKASVLKKALRTLDINAGARIDEASAQASILDVIRMQSPSVTPDGASQMLIRLLERDDATEDLQSEGLPISLRDRIHYIKINGVGHVTPVCDAKTMVEIIWSLDTTAGKSFKRESAQVMCQVMGGDVSLCAEIEARNDRLKSTPAGRSYQGFVLGGATAQEPQAKRTRIGPPIIELASEEEYAKYVQVGLKHEMVKSEVCLVMSLKDALEKIRPLEPRDRIELCDRLTEIQQRAFRGLKAPRPAITQQQDPGQDIPTPLCSLGVRGEEISIAMIATELGVSIRGRGGLIGKKLKALYAERYGQNAANKIPKRPVIYAGRPYHENCYWRRDRDLVERAITSVIG